MSNVEEFLEKLGFCLITISSADPDSNCEFGGNECSKKATWLVDGSNYCSKHGEEIYIALKIEGRRRRDIKV